VGSDPVVVLLYEGSFDEVESIYRGLQSVADEVGAWRVMTLEAGEEALLTELVHQGNLKAVLGGFVSEQWVENWRARKLNLVNICRLSHIDSVASVLVDDRGVGRFVASELVGRGFKDFAYAGLSGYLYTHERWEGYRDCLEEQGVQAVCAPSGWLVQGYGVWERWLRELSFPALVFAASDYMARRIIRAADLAGLRVPEDVSVVGVGNLFRESLRARMGIASVELPGYELGRKAAELIDDECIDVTSTTELEPVRLWERESLKPDASVDYVVKRALELMRVHIRNPMSVERLARRLGVSRRLMELRFNEFLGESPYRKYLGMRIEEAARMLLETDRKVLDVAERCGFSSQHQFANVFKRERGCSPRRYREVEGQLPR